MKILLVGEYSRLHNSLKEGLELLNHDVTIVAAKDGFKNYEVDFPIYKTYEKGFLRKFKNLIYRFTKIDLESIQIKKQIINLKPKLSDFDVVQFINEASFLCTATIEKEIFDLISTWNKNVFLLSCGTDYISVKYAYDKKFRYSILTPYLNGKDQILSSYGLKYLEPDFVELHHHIYKSIVGVIASDLDYHLPLLNHPKYLGLIPNPINTEQLEFKPLKIEDKIVIFHGINSNNYYKKGNDIFEEALAIINQKYADKIKIITVRSLPYNEYIKTYNEAHIMLDQIYAYDQGFNALEAMSKGKVVFTGAEKEWLEYYNIKEDTIAINALPDAKTIATKLEWLILNPEKILEISIQARRFVETHHNYKTCAENYLKTWQNHI
ncbi:glycosyltransferase [Winogradskyella psychrotolerans]|uniref:glycosyltransferase family protein n=1 Tax=Winogradskyella psychrotolerans TaxID=1344585 RepID=UPI001C07BFD5|nr:glycosyltransferase [Winogradskyella psychrotolerans]MBU2919957.1 glycosyltransferase [Winogradskyella psychrotolerans]|eukprot:TRINITY_DN9849_c0_g1_i2.p1 TRINITY_DN9849_c0_g1~~TRINITY_DN9849_c0_g1_i2.p1  ORF type:complete len:380 (+),score=74.13 TRINITY_DN9849_c0_g1_i2:67-1206(+)